MPAVFTTFIVPKGGTATRDILDFVTDADGDTTYPQHTIRWQCKLTTSVAQVTSMDLDVPIT